MDFENDLEKSKNYVNITPNLERTKRSMMFEKTKGLPLRDIFDNIQQKI